jgi:hypothetical protein
MVGGIVIVAVDSNKSASTAAAVVPHGSHGLFRGFKKMTSVEQTSTARPAAKPADYQSCLNPLSRCIS